jgi:hypothetical protein
VEEEHFDTRSHHNGAVIKKMSLPKRLADGWCVVIPTDQRDFLAVDLLPPLVSLLGAEVAYDIQAIPLPENTRIDTAKHFCIMFFGRFEAPI